MSEHSLFVIGGDDDETISIVQSETGRSCRLMCAVRGETHQAEEADFFKALQTLRRRALEPKGLIPFCYGASLKVWPSGMARDMGRGLKAYKIEKGRQASELVGIFDSGPDVIPAVADRNSVAGCIELCETPTGKVAALNACRRVDEIENVSRRKRQVTNLVFGENRANGCGR